MKIHYITEQQFLKLWATLNEKGWANVIVTTWEKALWFNRARNDMFVGNGARKVGGITNDGKFWVDGQYSKLAWV